MESNERAIPQKHRLERWTLLINACGLLLVAFSILYSSRQTAEMARQNQNNAIHSMFQNVLDLDKVMLERPKLRPYFYSNVDIRADDPMYPEAEALAEMTLDIFDYATQGDFRVAWNHPETWDRWIVDSFANSPFLRRYYESKKDWYGPKLAELKKRGDEQASGPK